MALNLFKKKEQKYQKEYCFGLTLKETNGIAFLLEIDKNQQKVQIINQNSFKYSNSWDNLTEDIDNAFFQLGKDSSYKVNKIIFFLYSHLIDQNNQQIKQPCLNKIKSITQELELKPLGYIDYHEVLDIYFCRKEQLSLTAIIIEVDQSLLSLFVYKAGKLFFFDSQAISDNLIKDIELILNKIKQKTILPSRIIIYDSSKLKDKAAEITAHEWSEDLFIQIPKVEALEVKQLEEALIFGFSSRIFDNEKSAETPKKDEEVLGFVINKDIKENLNKIISQKLDLDDDEKKTDLKENNNFLKKSVEFIKNTSYYFKHLLAMFKFRSYSIILPIIGLFIISLSLLAFLFFFHKASLAIYIQGKNIKTQLDIKGFIDDLSDKNGLKINKIEKTIEKEKTIETTGTKTVGDKAKGEITIYNSGPSEKTFKKGIILKTSGGMQFFLDSDVKVASASESITTEGNKLIITGKAKVTATAKDIGPEANIDKEKKLKIEEQSLDLVYAMPVNSFSGGTKQDIQIATKEDRSKLKEEVSKDIKEEAKSLKDKINNAKILDKLTKVELVEENYDKVIGEKTQNVTLKARGRVTIYFYNEDNLKKSILGLSDGFIPQDYELPIKNINYNIADAQEEKQKYDLTLAVSAKAVPKIDKNKLLQDILGKDIKNLDDIIKNKYKAESYQIKIQPSFVFVKKHLPLFKKNINLKIEPL